MDSEAAATYRFGRFALDAERGLLLVDGAERPLRAKSFALLRHFIEHPGRLIDRDEITEAIWPGVIVSDDSISQCVRDVRRALGDDAQQLLRTLPKRGFLFTAQVARGTEPPESGVPAEIPQAKPPLPNKPSIAVLPFQNMSGDPGQDYFVDGMVEEIITALSRIRWLFVIARNSSYSYKGQSPDIKQVGRELGVRYVLEGSVRKGGDRVRITGQLIDAMTGAHLWADRFDGAFEEVFDLQDKVALSVAGVIEPA
jgi:adenylate cyclase